MQTMTEIEMDFQISLLQKNVGATLSQALYNEKSLQLILEFQGTPHWVTFSLRPGVPFFFTSEQRPYLVKNLKKPLGLFIKTHFVGLHFTEVRRLESLGRVLELSFVGGGVIRFSLIPGFINIEAEFGEKKVSVLKPKALPQQEVSAEAPSREPRGQLCFFEAWQKQSERVQKNEKKPLGNDLKKKKKGLEKMQARLFELQNNQAQSAGDWLVENQSLEALPLEFQGFTDETQPLSWNIQNCFKQAKKIKEKVLGTQERISQLETEIQNLESGKLLKLKKTQKSKSLFAVAEARGKTLRFDSGVLYIGRSGPENLKLLRRAKPWFLWLHIKDHPGAHGIIATNQRNQWPMEKELKAAAVAIVKQSLPRGASGYFEVILAECRYVRPIKGAKSGQVTLSHEKVLGVRVD